MTPVTHSSVGLFRVQLWQVSSSSTPAPTSIVETSRSSVHAVALGSQLGSGSAPQPVVTAPVAAVVTASSRVESVVAGLSVPARIPQGPRRIGAYV